MTVKIFMFILLQYLIEYAVLCPSVEPNVAIPVSRVFGAVEGLT